MQNDSFLGRGCPLLQLADWSSPRSQRGSDVEPHVRVGDIGIPDLDFSEWILLLGLDAAHGTMPLGIANVLGVCNVYTRVVEPQHAAVARDHRACFLLVAETVNAIAIDRHPDAHFLLEDQLGALATFAFQIWRVLLRALHRRALAGIGHVRSGNVLSRCN